MYVCAFSSKRPPVGLLYVSLIVPGGIAVHVTDFPMLTLPKDVYAYKVIVDVFDTVDGTAEGSKQTTPPRM